MTSSPSNVVLTGPSHLLAGSDFSAGTDGWTLTGNRLSVEQPVHEPTSRGALNHYVSGSDTSLNVHGGADKDLWHFTAPAEFAGNHGLAYGGSLDFKLGSLGGDFSAGNLNGGTGLDGGVKIAELYCSQCATNTGITISFPLPLPFTGTTQSFTLPLLESSGWVQDPENTLKSWQPPTQCSFIEVLSGLTSVRILGDYTKWHETVSVDDVYFRKAAATSSLPFCSQGSPDGSVCTC